MGEVFPGIDEQLREFIGVQAMFFVATGPSDGGRVNASPKGYRDTFNQNSRLLRLFGIGRVVRPDDAEFGDLKGQLGLKHPGIRAVIVLDVDRIADSCGFSVPYYEFIDERPVLDTVHANRPDGRFAHRIVGDNAHSIDGLPALHPDHPIPSAIER